MSYAFGLSGTNDTPQALLRKFGMSTIDFVRVMPYIHMNVGTTDFGADGTKTLVRALQRSLSNNGTYRGPIDGWLGPNVEAALNRAFPPTGTWRTTTWFNLLDAIASRSEAKARMGRSGLGADTLFSAIAQSKIGQEIKQSAIEIAKDPKKKGPRPAGKGGKVTEVPASEQPQPDAGGGIMDFIKGNPLIVAGGVFAVLFLGTKLLKKRAA